MVKRPTAIAMLASKTWWSLAAALELCLLMVCRPWVKVIAIAGGDFLKGIHVAMEELNLDVRIARAQRTFGWLQFLDLWRLTLRLVLDMPSLQEIPLELLE